MATEERPRQTGQCIAGAPRGSRRRRGPPAPSPARRGRAPCGRPPRTQAATAAAVPIRRSPAGSSSTLPMKLLRDGPTRTGGPGRRSSEAGAAPPGCGPRPWRSRCPGRRSVWHGATPARSPQGQAPRAARRDLAHHVVVARARVHRRRSRRAGASPRRAPRARRPRARQRRRRSGSPLTSLTMSAPASRAARATSALVVSIESEARPRGSAGPRSPARRAGAPRRPRPGRAPGAGRLAAHVDDVGPGLEQARARGATASAGVGVGAPVGERVGGDVQDSHDPGPLAEDGLAAYPRESSRLALAPFAAGRLPLQVIPEAASFAAVTARGGARP